MLRTGYLHSGYTTSLAGFGKSVSLPRSGGVLLRRTIPGTAECDAAGPYPLLCCTDWSALPAELAGLDGHLVSIVVVTDPFGPDDPDALARGFSHGLVRYKEHSVIDLEVPIEQSACPHHRRNARKALGRLTVEELVEPVLYFETWCELYAELIARHRVNGVAAFSRDAFAAQFSVPGLVAFRAVADDGNTVGMVIWFCQGDVGYYHLAAYSARGYAEKASYALFWAGVHQFRGRLRWLNLGAGAGAASDGSDGLSRFKRGWSPLTRPTYLGRHVGCPGRYAELCRGRPPTDFFPAYRVAPVTAARPETSQCPVRLT